MRGIAIDAVKSRALAAFIFLSLSRTKKETSYIHILAKFYVKVRIIYSVRSFTTELCLGITAGINFILRSVKKFIFWTAGTPKECYSYLIK